MYLIRLIKSDVRTDLKHFMFYLISVLFFTGCTNESDIENTTDEVTVRLKMDYPSLQFKALGDPVHNVNRILVLPFQKAAGSQTDDDANYTPVFSLTKQFNVSSFPANNLTLKLLKNNIYKIVVVGYNQNDYDYTNQQNPANRFVIQAIPLPSRLSSLSLYPKSPTDIPEFFSCTAIASQGGTQIGTVFNADDNITLSGNLKRIVSGLTLRIVNIPTFVKSVTLSAEKLVNAIKTTDGTPLLWQVTGDGQSRIIGTQIPSSGTVNFSKILLPTLAANSTKLYLDIAYGSTSERYTINVPNSAYSVNNSIIFQPNILIDISGNYAQINIGFVINATIGLEDDKWDGI